MKKYIKYLQVALVFLTIVSCDKDYLDVNVDPNNPLTVSPDLALPVAQTYTATDIHGNRRLNTFGNLMMVNWSQSDGFSWYYDEFNYLVTPTFYSNIFDAAYLNTLKQYNTLIELPEEYSNYTAISKIMMSFHFQTLVDTYGDIPYFEALKRSENPTPKYDNAQEIYDDLIVKIDEAIALIKSADNTTVVPGADDVIFKGNMNKWIKFANTLKLRILIRQSGLSAKQAYIQQNIQNIINEGSGFITENAVINPGYLNEAGKVSPFYAAYGLTVSGQKQNNGEATVASDFIINYLQGINDPRIGRLYQEDPTGFLGVEQGLLNYPPDQSFEPTFTSNIGPGLLKGATQDAPLMLLTEALFLQSEAALKGYLPGNAQELYESAIQASFDFLGATGASGYYGSNNVNVGWNVSPNKLEAIITQKWIALNGVNAHESWVEYNRTGFPKGLPVPLNNTRSDRPVRLAYPSSEITGNSANMPAQPNPFTDKIFWAN